MKRHEQDMDGVGALMEAPATDYQAEITYQDGRVEVSDVWKPGRIDRSAIEAEILMRAEPPAHSVRVIHMEPSVVRFRAYKLGDADRPLHVSNPLCKISGARCIPENVV